eukprot:610178-Pelagomonas_calceolata.AAC.2
MLAPEPTQQLKNGSMVERQSKYGWIAHKKEAKTGTTWPAMPCTTTMNGQESASWQSSMLSIWWNPSIW